MAFLPERSGAVFELFAGSDMGEGTPVILNENPMRSLNYFNRVFRVCPSVVLGRWLGKGEEFSPRRITRWAPL